VLMSLFTLGQCYVVVIDDGNDLHEVCNAEGSQQTIQSSLVSVKGVMIV